MPQRLNLLCPRPSNYQCQSNHKCAQPRRRGAQTPAKAVVRAEKQADTEQEQDHARAVLTELFNEARSPRTPIIVIRICLIGHMDISSNIIDPFLGVQPH